MRAIVPGCHKMNLTQQPDLLRQRCSDRLEGRLTRGVRPLRMRVRSASAIDSCSCTGNPGPGGVHVAQGAVQGALTQRARAVAAGRRGCLGRWQGPPAQSVSSHCALLVQHQLASAQ